MRILGRLILNPTQTPVPGWIEIEQDRITRLETGTPAFKPDLGHPDALISPGFIDAHMHVPQIRAIGCDGLPLLEWLQTVIFPTESRWSDADEARADLALTQRRLLRSGTLACAGFLSPHPTGINVLAEQPTPWPMRMKLGQALMDREGPDDLITQPIASLESAAASNVEFTVNPRFAVSCSASSMYEAATRAREGDHFIQTHLAESKAEVAWIRSHFPDAASYTDVYRRAGLLGPKTLLAHGIHLSDDELDCIHDTDSVIVHCPTANTFLGSGLFDYRRASARGIRIALGTDIGAGPDVAMPRVGRAMIEVARGRRMLNASDTKAEPDPTPADAWTLMTRGNADALGWSDAGRLEPGCRADLLILRPTIPMDEHWLGRLLFGWENDWIHDRILAGTRIDLDAHDVDGAAMHS